MTSDRDVDLEQWIADWQAAPDSIESAEQVRRYVTRRSRLLWSFAVADVVVGGVALPVLAYVGLASKSDVERMAMFSLISITIAAVMFGWWNRRGVLHSSTTTIADYVAISAERLRRMRTAWRIGWMLLIAEVIVFSIWVWDRLYGGGRLLLPGEAQFAWSWLGAFALAGGFGMWKFGRWLNRDAERFDALKRELAADAPSQFREQIPHRKRKARQQRRG